MYQTIFYEKTFSGVGEIQYLTEPFYVRNHRMWRGSLQILELNTGSIVQVIIQTSETGNINHDEDWINIASTSLNSLSTTTIQGTNLLSYIRFKIVTTNRMGRSNAKITLAGCSYETSV